MVYEWMKNLSLKENEKVNQMKDYMKVCEWMK